MDDERVRTYLSRASLVFGSDRTRTKPKSQLTIGYYVRVRPKHSYSRRTSLDLRSFSTALSICERFSYFIYLLFGVFEFRVRETYACVRVKL